ncbi:YbaB/EbfC family nucleoid-associated protein [Catenulispora sp. NF23]|uniref:YbaB/EbfC family nucleoid-associated protein n=1 Tax=Catenulispora pinistramenti TaxID=2705254 RepID=A0ABS5KHA8_9ACTN|nr:YbaB/EbfC family nucleoid-associated protein [Catenulispora pinistramenti]MBS2533652.1 YbaB/EbfC family nucleoid-associated protein [Catenulispora pinistramenti]MBS2545731.1 YbaB/EbfC family nucleoid-associated protein [Catenulispora pinistramenti]
MSPTERAQRAMSNLNAFPEDVDQLLEQYRQRRAEAGQIQRKMREVASSATAPRQVVKVTVGAQGELKALEFPTGAYKRLPPAELAELILTTAQEAQTKAMAAIQELVLPKLPGGLNFADLIKGTTDLAQAMPEEPPMPEVVRDYIDGGRSASHMLGGNHG